MTHDDLQQLGLQLLIIIFCMNIRVPNYFELLEYVKLLMPLLDDDQLHKTIV
jgi:hypothetical protein